MSNVHKITNTDAKEQSTYDWITGIYNALKYVVLSIYNFIKWIVVATFDSFVGADGNKNLKMYIRSTFQMFGWLTAAILVMSLIL